MLKERQIVFLLLENFKTSDISEMLYGFDHLAKCECGTDLHAFMTHWQNILDNMCSPIPTVNLRDVFYRKIKSVESLKQDINIYERYHENNGSKTYEWLVGIVSQEIRLQRQDRNTAERELLMREGPPAKAKTPAPAQDEPTPTAKAKAQPKTPEQKEADKLTASLRKELVAAQLSVASLTKYFALANVGGKVGGKGEGKGQKGKGEKGPKKACWFFNTTGFSRTAENCYFSRAVLLKEDKAKLTKPPSRATSPSVWTPEPKAPGAAMGKGTGKDSVSYCLQFEKTHHCNRPAGECQYPHLTTAEVDALKAK